jgi:hypothetical protein
MAFSSEVDARVLARDPLVTLARVELGATLYLDEPVHWAREGAARALEVFLSRTPAELRCWYTTSHLDNWVRARPALEAEWVENLRISGLAAQPRHLFEFALADDAGTPSQGFRYREVDPRRAERAPYIELTLPQEASGADLETLVREVAACGPVLCGVGGATVRWNPLYRFTAFARIRGWCKRFLGVDVQEPEESCWTAREKLPGSNWLTVCGPGFAVRPELAALAAWTGPADAVQVSELGGGSLLVRAGKEPTLGDRNALDFPAALARVAAALAPLFGPPPEGVGIWQRRIPGPKEWMHRLVDPEAWIRHVPDV